MAMASAELRLPPARRRHLGAPCAASACFSRAAFTFKPRFRENRSFLFVRFGVPKPNWGRKSEVGSGFSFSWIGNVPRCVVSSVSEAHASQMVGLTEPDAVQCVPLSPLFPENLPKKLSISVTLLELGTIPEDIELENYQVKNKNGIRYLFPIGYKSVKKYKGIEFLQTIEKGPKGPLFIVTNSQKTWKGDSAERVWYDLSTELGLNAKYTSSNAKDFYGFNHRDVLSILSSDFSQLQRTMNKEPESVIRNVSSQTSQSTRKTSKSQHLKETKGKPNGNFISWKEFKHILNPPLKKYPHYVLSKPMSESPSELGKTAPLFEYSTAESDDVTYDHDHDDGEDDNFDDGEKRKIYVERINDAPNQLNVMKKDSVKGGSDTDEDSDVDAAIEEDVKEEYTIKSEGMKHEHDAESGSELLESMFEDAEDVKVDDESGELVRWEEETDIGQGKRRKNKKEQKASSSGNQWDFKEETDFDADDELLRNGKFRNKLNGLKLELSDEILVGQRNYIQGDFMHSGENENEKEMGRENKKDDTMVLYNRNGSTNSQSEEETEGEESVEEEEEGDEEILKLQLENKISYLKSASQLTVVYFNSSVSERNSRKRSVENEMENYLASILLAIVPTPSSYLFVVFCEDNKFRLTSADGLEIFSSVTEEKKIRRRLQNNFEKISSSSLNCPKIPPPEFWIKIKNKNEFISYCNGDHSTAQFAQSLQKISLLGKKKLF